MAALWPWVSKQGRTVDFLLTAKRDVAAAKRFFQKAMCENGAPRVITLDAYAASHRAVRDSGLRHVFVPNTKPWSDIR
jgi:transposase-like protein